MSNPITDVRGKIIDDLKSSFPDAEVLSGPRSGKAVDKPRLCVFLAPSGNVELGQTVVVGEARLVVRYWPKTAKVRDDAVSGVRDPAPLEQAAWDIAEFFQTKQVAYPDVWYLRLVSVVPDYDPDEWGVEATVLARFANPAVV